jgi:hypothetical protein
MDDVQYSEDRQEAPEVVPVHGGRALHRNLAIGTVVVVLAGVATGAFFLGRSSSRVTHTATATTTTVPAQQSSRTAIEVFAHWTEEGTLSPRISVTGHLTGGSCWTSSIADSADQEAWRCMSDNGIYDPCFAPSESANLTQVACFESPWSGAQLLDLTQPLSYSSSDTTNGGISLPWFMQLANGDRCGLITGAAGEAGGVTLNYGCQSADASTPNMTTQPWTVEYLPNGSDVLSTVDVVTAWR